MIFRRIIDTVSITGAAGVAITTDQTLTYRIRQEPRRLEAIVLNIRHPGMLSAAASSKMYDNGLSSLVKEVRLRVNDNLGSRNMIQVKGGDLMEWNRQNGIQWDPDSFEACPTHIASASAQLGVGASITNQVNLFIPIRHPLFEEPFGNFLSLPLGQDFLREDPIIEIDLGQLSTFSTLYTANAGNVIVNAMFLYREVPNNVPYIPSEFRTDSWRWQGTGKQQYEFASNGFLTQFMVRNFDSSNLERGAVPAANELWSLEYGREILARFDERVMAAFNFMSGPSGAIGTNNLTGGSAIYRFVSGNNQPTYGCMVDFLADLPITSAFGISSVPNLSTLNLGGDKLRLSTVVGTAGTTRVSYHKLLPPSADKLKQLLSQGV